MHGGEEKRGEKVIRVSLSSLPGPILTVQLLKSPKVELMKEKGAFGRVPSIVRTSCPLGTWRPGVVLVEDMLVLCALEWTSIAPQNEKKARITARRTVVVGTLIFAVTLVRFERLCRYSKGVGSLSRET